MIDIINIEHIKEKRKDYLKLTVYDRDSREKLIVEDMLHLIQWVEWLTSEEYRQKVMKADKRNREYPRMDHH